MADNYLEFSEVIAKLAPAEEAWLEEQLKSVYVFGDKEYPQDDLPADLDPAEATWHGCRAFRDMEDYEDDCDDGAGFCHDFHDDHDTPGGWDRHLWIYSDGYGDVRRVVHLVQKFLRAFRPNECWTMTYSITCSKPRVGEFGGGGVFVAVNEIKWHDSHGLVDDDRQAFRAASGLHNSSTQS